MIEYENLKDVIFNNFWGLISKEIPSDIINVFAFQNRHDPLAVVMVHHPSLLCSLVTLSIYQGKVERKNYLKKPGQAGHCYHCCWTITVIVRAARGMVRVCVNSSVASFGYPHLVSWEGTLPLHIPPTPFYPAPN